MNTDGQNSERRLEENQSTENSSTDCYSHRIEVETHSANGSSELNDKTEQGDNNMAYNDDDDDGCCPICLTSEKTMAWGSCRHACCVECLERHLCSSTSPQHMPVERMGEEVAVIKTPTLGQCPLCRKEISLFDLKIFVDKKQGDDDQVGEQDENETREIFLNPKNYDLTPLKGFVYVDASSSKVAGGTDGIGYGSFHFPVQTKTTTSNGENGGEVDASETTTVMPYFNIENLPRLTASSRLLPSHIPLQDAHYHEKTRTFCGQLHFNMGPFSQWDIYLSFSNDLSFVRTGLIRKRRRVPNSEQDFTGIYYPLEGQWKVVIEGGSVDRTIQIVGNGYYDERGIYRMIKCECSEGKALMIHGGTGKRIFEAKLVTTPIPVESNPLEHGEKASEVNEKKEIKKPDVVIVAPNIGEKLIWTRYVDAEEDNEFLNSHFPPLRETSETWIRESVSLELPPDEVNQLGGRSGRIFQRWITSYDGSNNGGTGRQAPIYNKTSIWGNTFCQGLRIGLASYHFNVTGEEQSAYISYEHPATSEWPPLDNGMPVPSRVPFRGVHFPDTHTFRGSIYWMDDYGTSWQGMARWDYEMKFDSDFFCILSGNVKSITVTGNEIDMSSYGEDLVYVNAALYDHFRQEHQQQETSQISTLQSSLTDDPTISTNSAAATSVYHDFQAGYEHLRQRLASEAGASVRTMAIIHRIFTAACSGQENPIDYNF